MGNGYHCLAYWGLWAMYFVTMGSFLVVVCRSFGFKTMLLDHIDAPEPILKYLCSRYFVHNVPIAGELSANQIEQVHIMCCVLVGHYRPAVIEVK